MSIYTQGDSMNTVGKLMLKCKKAMTIDEIADKTGVSYSHAKNSVTSWRDMLWLPRNKRIERQFTKKGTKYKVADSELLW